MLRNYSLVFALGALNLLARPAAAQPPALPQLPPPARAPEPHTVMRVPVELRITIEDLQKQVLRSLMEKAQKADAKAEPKLPFVLKGNEPKFALGADAGPPEQPKPVAEGAAAQAPAPPAARPQLIPRQPGERPRLDRLGSRPLVRALVDQMMGTVELTYQIELRSFKMTVAGNALTCEFGAGFHCETKPTAPGQAMPPANARDIGVKLAITKNLEWNENGKLELKEGTSTIWIDPDAPLVGFPRLDIERIIKLNGILAMLNGTLDRELMKRFTGENLPDLNVIAPTLKQKIPLMAPTELTAYPIRGDAQHVYFPFVLGLVPANKAANDAIAIASRPGPAPEPKIRGRITFDKDGKPEVKLDPAGNK